MKDIKTTRAGMATVGLIAVGSIIEGVASGRVTLDWQVVVLAIGLFWLAIKAKDS